MYMSPAYLSSPEIDIVIPVVFEGLAESIISFHILGFLWIPRRSSRFIPRLSLDTGYVDLLALKCLPDVHLVRFCE